MKLMICMDDTDNLESKGTGWLVEDACREMTAMGWGRYSMISRHQLFVHPDIPYTSHNSSMVFTADTDVPGETYANFLSAYLEKTARQVPIRVCALRMNRRTEPGKPLSPLGCAPRRRS